MNRRDFCKTAGAAAAVAATSTLQAEDKKRARANKGLIYKSVKWGGQPNLPRMQKLKELGFDGIEGSAPGMNVGALRKACDEVGLPMHGVVYNKHWQKRLSSPVEAERNESRKGLEAAIRESKAVGGSSVLLVPGVVRGEQNNESHEQVWERSIAEIRKVIPLASKLGIHVLIETVWNGFCYKPEQFRDYLDEINNPWVQAYYDIGNMQKFAPSHEWIRILGNRNVKLDVKDWGKSNGFCKIGDGDVDWPDVRKALGEIGFTGWSTAEVGGGKRDRIKEIHDRMDKHLLGKG